MFLRFLPLGLIRRNGAPKLCLHTPKLSEGDLEDPGFLSGIDVKRKARIPNRPNPSLKDLLSFNGINKLKADPFSLVTPEIFWNSQEPVEPRRTDLKMIAARKWIKDVEYDADTTTDTLDLIDRHTLGAVDKNPQNPAAFLGEDKIVKCQSH